MASIIHNVPEISDNFLCIEHALGILDLEGCIWNFELNRDVFKRLMNG